MWVPALFVCMFDKLVNFSANTWVVIAGGGWLCCVFEIHYYSNRALRRTSCLTFVNPCFSVWVHALFVCMFDKLVNFSASTWVVITDGRWL